MAGDTSELKPLFDFYDLIHDDDAYFERFKNIPSLQDYLLALWRIVQERGDTEPDTGQIVEMLTLAFEGPPADFDEAWNECTSPADRNLSAEDSFAGLCHTLKFQIADLRRIEEAGQMDDKFLYMGIQSPTGNSWYNFDPGTYLVCAFGGMGFHDRKFISRLRGWRMLEEILELGRLYE